MRLKSGGLAEAGLSSSQVSRPLPPPHSQIAVPPSPAEDKGSITTPKQTSYPGGVPEECGCEIKLTSLSKSKEKWWLATMGRLKIGLPQTLKHK